MNFITYNKLNDLTIHELRDFARSVGVQSPTSKKKKEIIKEVLLIIKGEAKPYVNKTKQGRPVKSSGFGMEDVYGLLLTDDVLTTGFEEVDHNTEYNVDYDFEGKQAFFVNAPKAAYNEEENEKDLSSEDESILVSGFLDVHKQNYGVVRVNGFSPSKNDVYVQPKIIVKHNLKSGDFVVGKAVLLQQDKPKVLLQVEKVNNIVVEDTSSLQNIFQKNYDEYEYNKLNKEILVADNLLNVVENKYFEGSRNFVYKTGFNYKQQISISEELVKQGYKLFGVYLNAMPEHKSVVKNNLHIDCIPFNAPEKNVIIAVNMLVSAAKRGLENGEKVIVGINNFSNLINAVNINNSKSYEKTLKKETVQFIKNFLSIAKNADNGGSISIFVMDDLTVEDKILDLYKFDLFKFFNTLQEINKNNEIVELKK